MLEVLQILEGEVNLREQTRVAQQARAAMETKEYEHQAHQLADTQKVLRERDDKVIDRIKQLPDGEEEFAYEINLLGKVSSVMSEATEILARPETGSQAIAAETEAIELLLQSKRINPKGGGGGGANPGGGGSGTTHDSAMASWAAARTRRKCAKTAGLAGDRRVGCRPARRVPGRAR